MSRIRVLIAEDYALMRSGIARSVAAEPDMEVAGVAGDGAAALALFAGVKPELSLIGLRLPLLDSFALMHSIRARQPDARMVALTAVLSEMLIRKALRAGATCILPKHVLRGELIETIRAVSAGRAPMHEEVAAILARGSLGEMLTEREVAVLGKIAQGCSNRDVAMALAISEHTVKGHLKSAMRKLGASDRTHAVMIALRRGFLDVEL